MSIHQMRWGMKSEGWDPRDLLSIQALLVIILCQRGGGGGGWGRGCSFEGPSSRLQLKVSPQGRGRRLQGAVCTHSRGYYVSVWLLAHKGPVKHRNSFCSLHHLPCLPSQCPGSACSVSVFLTGPFPQISGELQLSVFNKSSHDWRSESQS